VIRIPGYRSRSPGSIPGLKRGPLSLVSTNEELLERKSSDSGLETEITDVGIRQVDHVAPLYPQKLALTSTTLGGRSVGIVRSRTKATEFSLILLYSVGRTPWVGDQPVARPLPTQDITNTE
jgi:hypothetical protein